MKLLAIQFSSASCYFTWVQKFSLSILLSNTLSLCFHTGVRDQVSHPYTTTGKTVIFIFMLLDTGKEDERFQNVW